MPLKYLGNFTTTPELIPPHWIEEYLTEDRYTENSEERIANIRSYILNSINNTVAKMSRISLEKPIVDKIIDCLDEYLIPWLEYDPNKGEFLMKREIIHELKQNYGISSLQLLGETVGWEFTKQYWIKKSEKNISCVHVPLKDFITFLTAEPRKEQIEIIYHKSI